MSFAMSDERYPVVEIFHTLQGEGVQTGRAAVFVRLAGCGNGCPWCDTAGAQDPAAGVPMSSREIAGKVAAFGARTVIVTGGEPLLHNLDSLTRTLHDAGVEVLLETSGTYPLSGEFDWICLSPKRFAPPVESIFAAADELKVVVSDERDLEYAEECAAKVSGKCRLCLQPEWNGLRETVPVVVEYVKGNPGWRLSLQTHKFINIP